jgi:hypothetical protein
MGRAAGKSRSRPGWGPALGAPGRGDGRRAVRGRFVHRGLPPAAVADHERGWTYFLGVLRGLSR